MSTKQQNQNIFLFLNSMRLSLSSLLTLFFLGGCATPTPYITFSEPKVYSNDQVVAALNSQYRKLQDVADKLTANDLQSVFAIKQATQLDTNISASPAGPAGSPAVAAPGKIDSGNIDLTKLTIPDANTGLSYSASLRKRMNDAWEVMGRSLYLSGDQSLKRASNVILVRFDVGINNYIPADAFFDTKRFAYIKFTVTRDKNKKETDEDITIYSLEPDFNSTVSKESLITDSLENYQGEAGGSNGAINAQGAFRYQRALDEAFQTLVEEPMQFAVYGSTKNEFGCALGPMRKVVKRSWINPARIFGDKYRIDYIIEPGVRQCYALIVLEEGSIDQLKIKPSYYRRSFMDESNWGPSTESNKCKDIPSQAECHLGVYVKVINITDKTLGQFMWGDPWSTETMKTIAVPPISRTKIAKIIGSDKIFPKVTSTLLVSTSLALSPDTKVSVGPAEVAPSDIEILGRNLLRVTLPPNPALQELAGIPSPPTQSPKNPGNKPVKVANTNSSDGNDQKMLIIIPGCLNDQDNCKNEVPVTLVNYADDKQPADRDKNLKEQTTTQKFVYP
jgi:hypothetical protein